MNIQLNFKTIVIISTILGLITWADCKTLTAADSGTCPNPTYGDLHNAGLGKVTPDMDMQTMYDSLSAFYSEQGYKYQFDISWAQTTIDNLKAGTAFNNIGLSKSAQGYLNSLTTQLLRSSSQDQTVSLIATLSKTVQNDKSLVDSEKTLLCNTFGVAQSSSLFWITAANDQKNIWNAASLATDKPVYCAKVKWWKLLGDLGGFVVGTAVGGPATGLGLGALVSGCID